MSFLRRTYFASATPVFAPARVWVRIIISVCVSKTPFVCCPRLRLFFHIFGTINRTRLTIVWSSILYRSHVLRLSIQGGIPPTNFLHSWWILFRGRAFLVIMAEVLRDKFWSRNWWFFLGLLWRDRCSGRTVYWRKIMMRCANYYVSTFWRYRAYAAINSFFFKESYKVDERLIEIWTNHNGP